MSALSLKDMAPGFTDAISQSQVVFRSALDAMARPGTSIYLAAASLVSASTPGSAAEAPNTPINRQAV